MADQNDPTVNSDEQGKPESAFDAYYRQFGNDPFPSKTKYENEFGDREANPYPSQDSYENDFGDNKKEVDPSIAEDTDETEVDTDETEEQNALRNTGADSFTYNPKGGSGNILRKFRRGRLVLLVLFPVVAIVFSIFISGPLKLIQIGKMFENFHMGANQTTSNSRVGRIIEHYRTGNDPSKRNLGYLAEKISSRQQDDLRNRGIETSYTAPDGRNTRRIQSLTIDTESPAGRRALEELKSQGFNVTESGNRAVVDFNNGSDGRIVDARMRRRALDISIESMGKSKVTTAITKRLLRVRAGVNFRPFTNTARDNVEQWRKNRAQRINEGVDPNDIRAPDAEQTEDPETGETTTDPDTEGASKETKAIVDEVQKADTPTARRGIGSRLAGGAAATIGILCMMKDIGDDVVEYQHANTILPAIRSGMEFVAVASQIQAAMKGDAPMPDLVEMQRFSEITDPTPLPTDANVASGLFGGVAKAATQYTEREIASSKPFMNAESIERQLGVAEGGQPLPADVDFGGADEKPLFFQMIDNIPLLGGACGAIEGAFGFLKKIPVIGWGVQAYEKVVAEGIDAVLSVGGTSMEDLTNTAVSWIANDALDIESATGALAGGIADVGVVLAEADVANGMGGGEITDVEFATLNEDVEYVRSYASSNRSWFERTLDIREPDSIAAQTIAKLPSYKGDYTTVQNIATASNSLLGSFASIDNSFSKKVSAAAKVPHDYKVKRYGFTIAELEAQITADPYANADYVEPKLGDLNERYDGCFGTKVEPNNGKFSLKFAESPEYDKRSDSKCRDGSEDLLRYRFYLLDTVTARSMACYEGIDEESCTELGISGTSNASAGSIASENGVQAGDFVTDASVLNCDGYRRLNGPKAQIGANGEVLNEAISPYSADVQQRCNELKTQCLSGVSGTVKALCSAFEFDDVYYGNQYSPSAAQKYGFSIGNVAIYNAKKWYDERTPGLSRNNLLECSGLTAVAVYRAYGYTDVIGCSGLWGARSYPSLFKDVAQNEIQAGDFLTYTFQCNSGGRGHIAIAAGPVRPDGKILVYETSSSGTTAHFKLEDMSKFAGNLSRWIGPGI